MLTFLEFINECTLKHTNHIAYKYTKNGSIYDVDFYKFKDDILNFAGYFQAKGISNKHIALVAKNSYEWIVAYFGIVISGNVVVPIDCSLEEKDIVLKYNFADCSGLVTDKNDLISTIESSLSVGIGTRDETEQLNNIIQKKYPFTDAEYCNSKANQCSVIMFTAGTTGNSKGVELSQQAIIENAKNIANADMTDKDIALTILPFHHAYCFTVNVIKQLEIGATACIPDESLSLFAAFKIFNPSIIIVVPMIIETFYKVLAGKQITSKEALYATAMLGSNMKMVYSGGAFLNQKYIDYFEKMGVNIYQGYGMTECGPVISNNFYNNIKPNSVGKPVNGTNIKIIDNEIYVYSKSNMLGYYKNQTETNRILVDGWVRTEDLGYIDDDGYLYLTGRKKDLIILSNGENVSPSQIENELLKNDEISEIIVKEGGVGLVAEIYPNEIVLNDPNKENIIGEIIDKYNIRQPNYLKISKILINEVPFKRNQMNKIIR